MKRIKNTYNITYTIYDDADGDIHEECKTKSIEGNNKEEACVSLLDMKVIEYQHIDMVLIIHSVETFWNEL